MAHDPMARDKRMSDAQGWNREGRPDGGRDDRGPRPDRENNRGPRGKRNTEDKE